MIAQQNDSASLPKRYRKYIEFSTIITLGIFVVAFYTMPKFEGDKLAQEQYIPPIENIEIPPETQQFEKPPPPARPSVPIESESEEVDDNLTIEETDLAEFQIMDEPPPPPENAVRFIAYDEAPEPVGGYAQIQKNVVYPEIAREAGIEGTVIVQAKISKDGVVRATKILKGIPKTGLDEAAIAAILKTRWKPAYQRDKAVTVWISIPVVFRLKSN